MREILFRGKPVTGERYFVNGGAIQGVTHELWQNSGRVFIMVFPKYLSKPNLYEVIPETVGQYTGLTDKNGKRIFEGDVVDILTENEEIGIVTYDDGGFWVEADGFCVDFHSNINGTDLEVIGNIHDNPELMKEETK